MKKLASAVITALFLLLVTIGTITPARAGNNVIVWAGMNLPSSYMNLLQRYDNVDKGQLLYMMFGGSQATQYFNCQVTAVTGLYVTVSPSATNTICSVLAFQADETETIGGPGGTGTAAALPADPTLIQVHGMLSANYANIGPLTVGSTSGQSVDNLIECTVITQDTTSLSLSFTSSLGVTTTSSANRDHLKTLYCQNKAGTSATTGTQTVPSADTGYVGIAFVPLAFGASTVSTITPVTTGKFLGFTPAQAVGSTPVILSPSSQQTGSSNISGTAAAGIVNATTNFQLGGVNIISSSSGVVFQPITSGGNVFFNNFANTQNNITIADAGGVTILKTLTLGSTFSGTPTNGDLALGRSTTTGEIEFGGSAAGLFDYGISTANIFSLNHGLNVSGTVTGSSNVGALNGNVFATVNGSSGLSSPTNLANGDIVAQRGASTGVYFMGGATAAAEMDYSINNLNNVSFKTSSGASYVNLDAAAYNIGSDRRWKKDIHDIPYGLAMVMKLQPRAFAWKSDGRPDLGFIAQEVKPLFPELVHQDAKGYYLVNYTGLIPVLTEAMQQQQHEIEALAAMVVLLLIAIVVILVRVRPVTRRV